VSSLPDADVLAASGLDDWEISPRLEPAATRPRNQLYDPKAWVPEHFKLPTPSERLQFGQQAGATGDRVVSLLPISDTSRRRLCEAHALGRTGSRHDEHGISALRCLLYELSVSLDIAGPIFSSPWQMQAPRQWTVARRGQLRTGLRLDATGPNGLFVNLGPEESWFLWVPISRSRLGEICETVPVLRLRVPPGWACLSPVDEVFHDGSTITASRALLQLTLFGSFSKKIGSGQ
jgi:hypothetical protein